VIICEILARNARMYGEEIALIEREPVKNSRRALTWQEFDIMANRLANALIARGIQKGDKVILLMVNCLEWLPVYFGILRAGALAVPLNFRFTAPDIRYCAEIAESTAIIFGEEFPERVNALKDEIPGLNDFIFVGPGGARPRARDSR